LLSALFIAESYLGVNKKALSGQHENPNGTMSLLFHKNFLYFSHVVGIFNGLLL